MKTFFALTTGLFGGIFIGMAAMGWAYEDDQKELKELRKEKLNREILEDLSKQEV